MRKPLLSLALLTAAWAASAAPAAPPCPASPMGRIGCAAVQQLDQPAGLKAWVRSVVSARAPAGDLADVESTLAAAAAESGGVELVAARDGRMPGVAVLTVQAKRHPAARLQLVLFPDPQDATKLGRLETVPVEDPALYRDWPERKVPDAQLAAVLQAELRKLVSVRDFSGCVSISHGKQALVDTCVGLAERSFSIPTSQATRFHIGSMDKMFTAVAIAQLVEAGKLSYDGKLTQLVHGYPSNPTTDRITVWQLLHHMSGLGDFFGPEFFEHREKFVQPADYLDLIARQPAVADPGTRWSYSNSGFVLLGRIVELASGEGYFEYIQHHVFGPAGMKDSGFDAVEDVTPNLAVGYLRDDPFALGPWKANWMTLPFKGSPAGGGYATAADLLRFAAALRSGKLLKPATLSKMFEGSIELRPDRRYAAGFEDLVFEGKHLRGHNGGAPGMNAQLTYVEETGYAVAVASNEDGPAAQELAEHLAELVARN